MENENKKLDAILLPDGLFSLEWEEQKLPLERSKVILQNEIEKKYKLSADSCALYIGFTSQSVQLSPSLSFLRSVSVTFVKTLTQNPEIENLRDRFRADLEPEQASALLENAPFMPGSEYLDESWIMRFRNRIQDAFLTEIRDFDGTVAEFIRHYSKELHITGRVFFHLVESKKEEYPFAFLATYSSGLDSAGNPIHLPLQSALAEFGKDSKRLLDLLATVQRASGKSAFIAEILESGEIFHPLSLSAKEAHTVLKEISLYEESGILCRIPDWWKKRSGGTKVNITVGTNTPSLLGINAILDFNASMSIGGASVSSEEAQKLLAMSEGLALIKGRWIEVDHERLALTLAAYERARKLHADGMSIADAMRFELQADESGVPGEIDDSVGIEITNGEWLASAFSRLARPATLPPVSFGTDFRATLRPYQLTGVSWLSSVLSLGFGACLADDMGLGKTVEVIALLNGMRTGKSASLLVVPASLIANWMAELTRFAPSLGFRVAHPSENSETDPIDPDSCDLVITTYGLLSRYEWISAHVWSCVILDEAQAIKNPGTKQTKAVKRLIAGKKIVMTGTPIENRLSDLWTLFDFLNPGLLGSAKEFTAFTKRLAASPEGYGRLKKVVSPFILRRVKTDKSVIDDLPEKIEMKTYALLTGKQAVLYSSLVKEVSERLMESADGIKRKGVVLASLMKFKQICNHPDQYLGKNEYDEKDSGKYECLREICETIAAKRERALVFTQFREITDYLRDFLNGIFKHEGLVFHGEIPVAKRKDIVEKFQSDEYVPFMVLSIKAGGVGLNLTCASHVIHFDRWWNPAVENQATDRAFRIGQNKNVVVHKFVTKGTVEEKIDAMIEAKQKLSGEIISDSGESWITEMNNEQLLDLFRLTE